MVSTQTDKEIDNDRSDIPVLKFDQVGLEYMVDGSPRRIIEEISLSISKGEFVTFVGPSGCGKTSILRMISGLAPALIGDVRYHDVPITKPLKISGLRFKVQC